MPDPSDPISTLQTLGFEMPSVAYFVGVCVFSLLGWIAYRRGKARAMPSTRWMGLALMLYPYVVSSTWLMYVVGVALCAAIYFNEKGMPFVRR